MFKVIGAVLWMLNTEGTPAQIQTFEQHSDEVAACDHTKRLIEQDYLNRGYAPPKSLVCVPTLEWIEPEETEPEQND
jgi:hypothetical protein